MKGFFDMQTKIIIDRLFDNRWRRITGDIPIFFDTEKTGSVFIKNMSETYFIYLAKGWKSRARVNIAIRPSQTIDFFTSFRNSKLLLNDFYVRANRSNNCATHVIVWLETVEREAVSD